MQLLLSTAYFPPVSYFIHLAQNGPAIIEIMETFPRQTYRNRCEILTSSGKLNLVVPVSKPDGNYTITRDIQISYREKWNRHHWKSIQTAYRSSPYFNYYADIFHPLFLSEENSLIDHNQHILRIILKLLDLDISPVYSQEYLKNTDGILDLREEISPKRRQRVPGIKRYQQVFSHKSGFVEDLSILDLIFNLGPEATDYLRKVGG